MGARECENRSVEDDCEENLQKMMMKPLRVEKRRMNKVYAYKDAYVFVEGEKTEVIEVLVAVRIEAITHCGDTKIKVNTDSGKARKNLVISSFLSLEM